MKGKVPASIFLSCSMWSTSFAPSHACPRRQSPSAAPQHRPQTSHVRHRPELVLPAGPNNALPAPCRARRPLHAAARPKSRSPLPAHDRTYGPRLSSARAPLVSRSSSATIRAFAATLVATACSSASGSSARTFAPWASSHAKNCRIAQHAVFQHFGIAGAQLARGQGAKRVEIGQHQRWLVERADEVLARRGVDGRLAAYRTVDLRQQRGRQLDEAAPAFQDGAGKTGEVADHPSAEREHMVAALDALLEQPVGQSLQFRPALRAFARRDIVPARAACRRPQATPRQSRPNARAALASATIGTIDLAQERCGQLCQSWPASRAQHALRSCGPPDSTGITATPKAPP